MESHNAAWHQNSNATRLLGVTHLGNKSDMNEEMISVMLACSRTTIEGTLWSFAAAAKFPTHNKQACFQGKHCPRVQTTHDTSVLLWRTLKKLKMMIIYQLLWADSRWQPDYQGLWCMLKAHVNCLRGNNLLINELWFMVFPCIQVRFPPDGKENKGFFIIVSYTWGEHMLSCSNI